jgi:thiamine biosynthesis protein ThiS
MQLVVNGQPREFETLGADPKLDDLLTVLGLKQDRVAVEHNGAIVSRAEWATTALAEADRLEIVHFVGGGTSRKLNYRSGK